MLKLSDIPNAICVLRMILVVPTVWALLNARFGVALLLVFVAGFSDALDGYLAKRFDWRSRLGGLLDPLADKLLLISLFVVLAVLGLIPVWLAGVVIGRDLVIVTGGVDLQFPHRASPARAIAEPASSTLWLSSSASSAFWRSRALIGPLNH